MIFTDPELEYLASQRLGRLATVGADGVLQINPVGFGYNLEADALDIGGRNMAASRKFRNGAANGRVAFVVDDIVSVDPWKVRGLEVRGEAEALRDAAPAGDGPSSEIIRIHPHQIFSWGVVPGERGMQRRDLG